MNYRIEPDNSIQRPPFGEYTYRIHDGARPIATYRHDARGEEHRIEFTDGHTEDSPVGRMTDFLQGGGREPLRLSDRAQAYLKARQQNAGTTDK